MSSVRDIFVSVAALLPERRAGIREKVAALSAFLAARYAHYEILLLEAPIAAGGGASEKSGCGADPEELLQTVPKVRWLRIFPGPDEKILTAAGIENAIGDLIVVGNLDFLSGENIARAVDLCCSGVDVVNGVCQWRKPWLYAIGDFWFRRLFGRMISYDLPKNDTGFRCVSRRIANAAMTARHFHRFVFLRLANAGGKTEDLKIEVPADAYRRYSLNGAFSKAVTMLVFNTVMPLRIINGVAITASLLALLGAAYSVGIRLLKNHVVEGWTTLMLMLSGFFFLLFVILSFLGEYLVRVILDRADAPPYAVVSERHSSVMLDLAMLNIREDSTSGSVNLTQTGRDR